MDIGYFEIQVSPGVYIPEYDEVILTGVNPPGDVLPTQLIMRVKRPHEFEKHKGLTLTAKWKDE